VVTDGRAINGKRCGVDVGPTRDERLSVLTPIGGDGRVLAADDGGAAAVLDEARGWIVRRADIHLKMNWHPPPGWDCQAFYDSAARLWLSRGYDSHAYGPDGQHLASHRGRLMLEDSRGGLWFSEYRPAAHLTTRLSPDGREATLEVGTGGMAEAPDGTVWALTGPGLIRLRADGQHLSIVERHIMPVSGGDKIWCDREGRLWHRHYEDPAYRLIRYATTPTALDLEGEGGRG
jgi:hypothetical protein